MVKFEPLRAPFADSYNETFYGEKKMYMYDVYWLQGPVVQSPITIILGYLITNQ